MNATFLDANENESIKIFGDLLFNYIEEKEGTYEDIVVLCIGTDRATGDSLGPLVGHKLAEDTGLQDYIALYGTLKKPVHAKNISETVKEIYSQHRQPLVIAVDASLGKTEHIGYLHFGHGSVTPGAGLNKNINAVGDIFVTGVVNTCGVMEFFTLQNTSLNVVMSMVDVICHGMISCLKKIEKNKICKDTEIDLKCIV